MGRAVDRASTTGVVHRALDGSRFRLSAEPAARLDLGRPFTSVVDIAAGGRRHELTAGSPQLGDEIARALGARLDEELSFQDGLLRTGRAIRRDRRSGVVDDLLVGVWRGRGHSLVTHLYRASTADLLGMMRTLRIEEDQDGIGVSPDRRSDVLFWAAASLVKQIPGLGLLEVAALTRQNVRDLPPWPGAATPAGELFGDLRPNGEPYFVLATSRAWVTVLPEPGATAARVRHLVGGLRVDRVDRGDRVV